MIPLFTGFDGSKEGDSFGMGALLNLQTGNGQTVFTEATQELSQRNADLQLDIHIDATGMTVDPIVPQVQEGQHKEDGKTAHKCYFIQTYTQCQSYAGGGPQTCGSGKSLDPIMCRNNNGSCTKEADTADHLRTHSYRISGAVGLIDVLVRHHDDTGPDAYQHIGPQTCRAVLTSSLKADDTPQDHCGNDP